MVGQYSVSGGPLKGPGGPNGPPVCYLKYALSLGDFVSSLFSHLLLMLAMHSGKIYMPRFTYILFVMVNCAGGYSLYSVKVIAGIYIFHQWF